MNTSQPFRRLRVSASLVLGALVATGCADATTADQAAELSPDHNVDLDGPGVRLRPAGTSSNCTFVSTRPASLPATAVLAPLTLQLSSSSTTTPLKAGDTLRVAAGAYTVSNNNFGAANVNSTPGSTQKVTPLYMGSALPMAFENLCVTLSSGAQRGISTSQTAAWWTAVPTTGTTAVAIGNNWRTCSNAPLNLTGRARADGALDVTPLLAQVELIFDDVDAAYPNYRSVLVSNQASSGRGAIGGESTLRTMPSKFLLAPDSFLSLQRGSWASSPFAAGTRSVLTFRRLEIEHLVPDGGTPIPGVFKVTNASGLTVLGYDNVPTHTGVDLLPGAYTVTITATDSRGVPYTDVQSVTL